MRIVWAARAEDPEMAGCLPLFFLGLISKSPIYMDWNEILCERSYAFEQVAKDPNVNHDIPLLPPAPLVSPLLSTLRLPQKPIFLRFQFSPINANSFDISTTFFDTTDPEEISTFCPPKRPEDFVPPPSFDEGPFEDEIAKAYEELYGAAYSGETFLGNNVYAMDSKVKKTTGFGSKSKKEKVRDGFAERVVQVRRVTEVVKGGKQLHSGLFWWWVINRRMCGLELARLRRNIITVPMTKYKTLPHRRKTDYGAARVMLRPASPGTGVIAGATISIMHDRIVLELAGVENASGKKLGSNDALNNARATVVAVQKMRQFSEVAEERGIPMEELWK
ncbi:30S ribosomal S5, chloroplastic [Olea europaea subsp. europaea]|uniref:30S ribosomal S5, chloroplastic n=1 Tax=Olea europaea subsp. europaea TaxID=158383 RepID=A0A8S0UDE3_OLEEU|nr:30S ribosomal S5, chloroplastic [Olea europaea subsp. europaea]